MNKQLAKELSNLANITRQDALDYDCWTKEYETLIGVASKIETIVAKHFIHSGMSDEILKVVSGHIRATIRNRKCAATARKENPELQTSKIRLY